MDKSKARKIAEGLASLSQEEVQAITSSLSDAELSAVLKILEEISLEGFSRTYHRIAAEDFVERPVDMETFLRDEYFLGAIETIYPRLVDDLVQLFSPEKDYYLVILGGSIGWGKSTFAELAIARMIYEISCLKNPQKSYGMRESATMYMANVSITFTQAKRVIFEGVKQTLKKSEYFRTIFPFEDLTSELRFRNKILLSAATQGQVLGMNTFAASVDEANFMSIVEGSVHAKVRGKKVHDQAEMVFNSLYRRMETRYMKAGMLPGKLMIMSSAQYPDDFIERKTKEYMDHPNAFIRNYAVWETKPAQIFLGPRFNVIFNRDLGSGRIAQEDEKPMVGEEVFDVPIEYQRDFEADMEGSIRDLKGWGTLAIEPFIRDRTKIQEMCDPSRRHGFSLYETTLRDGGTILKDVLCDLVEVKDDEGMVIGTKWQPKINPKAKRFAHVDPAITGDACGFVMGHISHYEERRKIRRVDTIDPTTGLLGSTREAVVEMEPIIIVDLILRIVPPPGGEIILGDIRALLYQLRDLGFRIGLVTYDSYQSKDSQQQLTLKGFKVDELSMDKSIEPYNRLRTALYEKRIIGYYHETLMIELRGLEKNTRKNKVDHRVNGSKDVADSLAGVVHNCETRKISDPVGVSLGEVEGVADEIARLKREEMQWLLDREPKKEGAVV